MPDASAKPPHARPPADRLHLAVLTAGADRPGWHVVDLARAAAARDIDIQRVSWRRIHGGLSSPSLPAVADADTSLDHVDAMLLRTMPAGSLEQIIFRMDLLGAAAGRGVTIVNPPRAIEIAVDKYLCLNRLNAAGAPTPATAVCQRAVDARAAFEALGGDVILKPLFGSEGFGMTRINDPDLADRAFTMLERMQSVIYLQQFIDHGGRDARLFVIAGQVVAAMERRSPGWRTNVAKGGDAVVIQPDDEQQALAIKAAAACGTLVAGVDLLEDRDGKRYVIEVNAVPGWRKLAEVTHIDIAGRVLDFIAELTRGRQGRKRHTDETDELNSPTDATSHNTADTHDALSAADPRNVFPRETQ